MEQLDKTTQSLLEGKSMTVHMTEDGQINPKIVARLAMYGFPRSEQLVSWLARSGSKKCNNKNSNKNLKAV